MLQKFTLSEKEKFDKIFKNKKGETEIEKGFYRKTEKYLKFIKWLPGIRMVGVGNSISMNSSSKNSDIDLLIVTTQNSMWFVRILVTLIFQVLGVRKNEKHHAGRFCLSFFCTLDGLDFSKFALEKDPYLYFWILYFKPILDYHNTYNLFIEKNNSWADLGEYKNILENNKNYIKYEKTPLFTREGSGVGFINNFLKKIFLPKTLNSYNKIAKPYGIIINDNMLKFHNGDVRKEVAEKF
ncbi:MAG: hypothetical protein Q9M94_03285 [Candidatus Gracilibacteria bacterium]|nr:hypothetical protein [Candidatus Gracilibacteria bacterium]MDQ7022633.1 hypothetical protein [Candidatus Gracilibacteria bacterium]